jgi:hypothetical protein
VLAVQGVWEAAGYPWSVRPEGVSAELAAWIRKHYRLSPEMQKQLLGISARQMDRRLRAKKQQKRRL